MNNKIAVLALSSLLLMPLFAYSVQGANIINDVFETLFGAGTSVLKINELYETYATIIDFALLMVLFIALADFTLKQRFGGRRSISIVIGIILAVGAEWWMSQRGFTLGMLGPIGVIIVLGLIGISIFYIIVKALEGEQKEYKSIAAAAAYILVYLAMKSVSPGIFGWLEENADIIAAILEILFVVALVYVGIGIYRIIAGMFRRGPAQSGTWGTPTGPGGGGGGAQTTQQAGPSTTQPGGGGQAGVVPLPQTAIPRYSGLTGMSLATFSYAFLFNPKDPKIKLDAIPTNMQLIESNIKMVNNQMNKDKAFHQRNSARFQKIIQLFGEARSALPLFSDSERNKLRNDFLNEAAKLKPPIKHIKRAADLEKIMNQAPNLKTAMESIRGSYAEYCRKMHNIKDELKKKK
jgi:hypothetical protein